MTDLTPGPEMDRAVAEAVGFSGEIRKNLMEPTRVSFMRTDVLPGYAPTVPWRPSRDIAHAIEALEATGMFWHAGCVSDGEYYATVFDLECDNDGLPEECREFCGDGVSIPEAACRAILAWAEAKEKNDDV